MAVGEAFSIEVVYGDSFSSSVRDVVTEAVRIWTSAIAEGLPNVTFDGRTVSNLLLYADSKPIDVPGRVIGRGGPRQLRPATAGRHAYLPAISEITFDSHDLPTLESEGRLPALVRHELAHALGFGTDVWLKKGLVADHGRADPTFRGREAMREFGDLLGRGPTPVPLQNRGGIGVANVHWRETVFQNELMSSYAPDQAEPLSRLTLAALADMGYVVNWGVADSYRLPEPLRRGPHGEVLRRATPHPPHFAPTELVVLPDDSLV